MIFETEKAQVITAFVVVTLCTIAMWAGIVYIILFGSVLMNAIFCLISAASAHWGEKLNGEAEGVDVFTARLFFVSTLVKGVMLFM